MSLKRSFIARTGAMGLSLVSGLALADEVVPPLGEAPAAPLPEAVPMHQDEDVESKVEMNIEKPAQVRGFSPLKTEAEISKWNTTARVAYRGPFDDKDSSGALRLRTSYELMPTYSVYAQQDMKINFVVDASKDEFELADTILGLQKDLPVSFPKASWDIGGEISLPLSRDSRYRETYLTAEVSSGLSYSLTPSIRIGVGGGAAWIWSAYQTAPASAGEDGENLALFNFALSQSLDYAMNDLWSMRFGSAYTETVYHSVEHDSSSEEIVYDLPDQGYSLELGVVRLLTLKTRLGVSYSIGSTLLQPGFDDYVIYDKATSVWSISLSHTFP